MAAEIGSSVGNNQAALEEQRKKQQEEATNKALETGASSDTAAAEKTSEKTNENSKQTDTGNKENPLSIQRPGTTDTSQTKETSNKFETNPNKISPLLPDLNKSSEKLSTKDLIANIAEKIEKTQARIDINPFNKSKNPNSIAEHIAARPDTLAFAAQQVKIETSRNREEQVKLEDDRNNQAAYQEVKSHAEKLIKDGKENEARKLLGQVIDKPETVRSLAEEIIAQRLSPQTINLRSLANLDLGRSESLAEMQATQHSQMTKEDHQNHTLELISGLIEKLDESAETFIRNKEMLNALINPKISESKDYINPFAELTQEPKNPFEININLPSKSDTKINPEDGFSMLHRLGSSPSNELIQKEIRDRETLHETLIQQREVQLRAQANLTKLAQAGKADQIHLLFDGKGNPLSTEAIKDRGSYNSGLPDELESKYRELNDFLKKDPSLEEGFAAMQDSLIGLSPEEQTVRARDFLTENLQAQRETLRLLQGINPNLNSIINDKNSSAIESLITIDQRTISQLTQETLSRRTDLMLELHDQLTENLNSGNFQEAAIAIEKTRKDLKDEVYTYRNNKLSDYELVNRDLTRTPKEDEEIQQRITALEEKFKALTDNQLNIVRGNMSNVDNHLKEFKSLNEPVPLGLFQEKGWRIVGGEADIRLESIESLQKHTERVLDNLLSQQKNVKDAHEHMTESQQIERYERRLEEIISQTSSKYQGAGAQASYDGENIRRRLDGLDNFYGNTETGLKFTKNAALIAGATLATGGAGTWLIGAGWGLTGSALAAGSIGTAYGAGVSLLSNSAEGLSRHGNGFNNPYENVLSQTWKETKMSASTAFSTATGMNLTRGLSAFTQAYKWGRYAPNVSKVASATIGGGASGFVSTNLSYGLDAAEKKFTTGNFDFNNEKYFKDLLWNTGAATVGGFIGGTFGQLQNATSNTTTRFRLIATEELTSIAADLKITHLRDGKITAEGLLQTFQASITGRTQAHFAAQNTSRPKNELAQQIRNQETVVKSSGELPDGVEAQTKVRVEPDGSRKVEIDAKEDLMRRAMDGDVEAQKKMLEETVAHARENPIDPQVKQADGSYKTMSTDQYHALRARQELVMRSVAEAKFADAQGSSVSATKQDSKVVLAEMNKAIKNGDFTRALELAEAKGVGEAYRKQFDADYKYNANRDRTKDALEQTNFLGKPDVAQKENYTKKFDALDTQITGINQKGEITPQEIDQLRKQVEDVDSLTDKQRERLSSQLDNLDTSKLSISEKADLAYLTGKINGNAQQRLNYEVDLAISNKYREDGPEAVTAHVKELGPKIEAQIAELQKLQKSGTDDKTLSEALGKLERLDLEMSAIRGSETVGVIAKDVEISSQIKNLDSFRIGKLAESLRNPDLETDARIKAEGFISDFNLKPEDIKARENAISKIDSIGLDIYKGNLEYSPEVAKQIQDIVDSINPEHMNPARIQELNSMIADIKNDATLKQLDSIAYDFYRDETNASPEKIAKYQKLVDSIDRKTLSPEQLEQLNSFIDTKNEAVKKITRNNTIVELNSIINDQEGDKTTSPEAIQAKLRELELETLDQASLDKIQSLLNDAQEAGIDISKIDGVDDIETAKYLKDTYGLEIQPETSFKESLAQLGLKKVRLDIDGFEGEAISIKYRDSEGNIPSTSETLRLTEETIRRINNLSSEEKKALPKELFNNKGEVERFLSRGELAGSVYHTKGSELDAINSSDKPIYITESAIKSMRLAEILGDDAHVLGLNGVESATRKGELSQSLDNIDLKGRKVILTPDSDYGTGNEGVARGVDRLAAELKARGADVEILKLPKPKEGKSQGIDDYTKGLDQSKSKDAIDKLERQNFESKDETESKKYSEDQVPELENVAKEYLKALEDLKKPLDKEEKQKIVDRKEELETKLKEAEFVFETESTKSIERLKSEIEADLSSINKKDLEAKIKELAKLSFQDYDTGNKKLRAELTEKAVKQLLELDYEAGVKTISEITKEKAFSDTESQARLENINNEARLSDLERKEQLTDAEKLALETSIKYKENFKRRTGIDISRSEQGQLIRDIETIKNGIDQIIKNFQKRELTAGEQQTIDNLENRISNAIALLPEISGLKGTEKTLKGIKDGINELVTNSKDPKKGLNPRFNGDLFEIEATAKGLQETLKHEVLELGARLHSNKHGEIDVDVISRGEIIGNDGNKIEGRLHTEQKDSTNAFNSINEKEPLKKMKDIGDEISELKQKIESEKNPENLSELHTRLDKLQQKELDHFILSGKKLTNERINSLKKDALKTAEDYKKALESGNAQKANRAKAKYEQLKKEYNRFRALKKQAEGISDLASRTTDAQRRYLINKYEKMVAIAKENNSEAAVMINTFGAKNNDLSFVRSDVHRAQDIANLLMVLDVIESVPGIHVLNESGDNIRAHLLGLRENN